MYDSPLVIQFRLHWHHPVDSRLFENTPHVRSLHVVPLPFFLQYFHVSQFHTTLCLLHLRNGFWCLKTELKHLEFTKKNHPSKRCFSNFLLTIKIAYIYLFCSRKTDFWSQNQIKRRKKLVSENKFEYLSEKNVPWIFNSLKNQFFVRKFVYGVKYCELKIDWQNQIMNNYSNGMLPNQEFINFLPKILFLRTEISQSFYLCPLRQNFPITLYIDG